MIQAQIKKLLQFHKKIRELEKHKGKLSLQETPIYDQTYTDDKTHISLQIDWLEKRRHEGRGDPPAAKKFKRKS